MLAQQAGDLTQRHEKELRRKVACFCGKRLTQDSYQLKASNPGGRKGRRLSANCGISQEISGPVGGAGEDWGVNINTQVFVQASLRIFIGN